MASEVTVTETSSGTVSEVKFDWLSHTDGVVTAKATSNSYNGRILGVLFIPDTSTTAPDDQYDATLLDGNGTDLLFGQGANLSGTLSVAVMSNLGFLAGGPMSFAATGAGSANGGICYVYVEDFGA